MMVHRPLASQSIYLRSWNFRVAGIWRLLLEKGKAELLEYFFANFREKSS